MNTTARTIAATALQKVILALIICVAGIEAHRMWGRTDLGPGSPLGVVAGGVIVMWSAAFAGLFLLSGVFAAILFHRSRWLNPNTVDFALFVLWCLVAMYVTVHVKIEG